MASTLGSFLFCLGIHPILEAIHASWPAVLVRAIGCLRQRRNYGHLYVCPEL